MPSFCINYQWLFLPHLSSVNLGGSFLVKGDDLEHPFLSQEPLLRDSRAADSRVLRCVAYALGEALLESTTFKFKRPRLNQNVTTRRCVKWLFLLWPIQCL